MACEKLLDLQVEGGQPTRPGEPGGYSGRTPMFFDPQNYLQADPAKAGSEREAARLRREAEQRARLCEVTTRLAGELGFGGAKIYLVAREAKLGLGTYYKLFESQEACLLEAFERCAAVVVGNLEEGVGERGGPTERAAAGLRRAVETLEADRDVAFLLLSGIRAGGAAGREAQQEWLDNLAELLAESCPGGGTTDGDWMAKMVVGALGTLLATRVRAGEAGDLERALPDLTYVLLAPYLGSEAATGAGRRCQERLIRESGQGRRGRGGARRRTIKSGRPPARRKSPV